MSKRRKNRQHTAYKVHPNDPLGKWGALLVHRGQPLLQLAPLGPRVTAGTPDELEAATAEAIANITKNGEPN